jgi:hypothetical protein
MSAYARSKTFSGGLNTGSSANTRLANHSLMVIGCMNGGSSPLVSSATQPIAAGRRHAALVARREEELRLLERRLGCLPVSEILPNTDREAAAFRPELVRRLAALPAQMFHSVEALVRRGLPAARISTPPIYLLADPFPPVSPVQR